MSGEISVIVSTLRKRRLKKAETHNLKYEDLYACGVYALYNHGKIVYIGRSTQVGHRLRSHCGRKDPKLFTEFAYISLPESETPKMERTLILTVRPKYNSKDEKFFPAYAK